MASGCVVSCRMQERLHSSFTFTTSLSLPFERSLQGAQCPSNHFDCVSALSSRNRYRYVSSKLQDSTCQEFIDIDLKLAESKYKADFVIPEA